MAAQAFTSIKGLVMRATRLDSCGRVVTGADSSIVSKGFVKIDLSGEVEEGEDFSTKLADGTYCVNERDRPVLKWLSAEMEFCKVDPEMLELIAGTRIIVDYDGDSTGWALNEQLSGDTSFALEVWTKRGGQACGASGYRWIYWLMSMFENAQIGNISFANATSTFTVTATSKANTAWGCGPYNVVPTNVGGTPGKLLTPGVTEGDHLLSMLTSVAPPTPMDGYHTTPVPAAVAC